MTDRVSGKLVRENCLGKLPRKIVRFRVMRVRKCSFAHGKKLSIPREPDIDLAISLFSKIEIPKLAIYFLKSFSNFSL